jgi:hypothetical protein
MELLGEWIYMMTRWRTEANSKTGAPRLDMLDVHISGIAHAVATAYQAMVLEGLVVQSADPLSLGTKGGWMI